jgi:hypothetical protein
VHKAWGNSQNVQLQWMHKSCHQWTGVLLCVLVKQSTLHSANKLIMQKDCTLVLYRLSEDGNHESVLWASKKGMKHKDCNEVHDWFQADFNLVLYGEDGEEIWASDTKWT